MAISLAKLSTERLNLAPASHSDWPLIYSMQSNPILKEEQTLEQLKSWFVEFIAPFKGEEGKWAAYVATDKQTGEGIGCFSVRIVCKHSAHAEIGYMIQLDEQGKGYASEGAMAIKEYLFTQLSMRRVSAMCNASNDASWKVMEKIGLQREGLMKQEYRINDTWHDTYIYGQVNPLFER